MIDPMVSLAFSIYSNKGTYALLLGSGISRASEIPTGWEIVLDLIRKIAKVEGEDPEPDPAAWYINKHGADPDYSKLLEMILKTPSERQQLLRAYFEPTEEEKARGIKLPSAGHKAIAQLVLAGYIRIIVTTNFDRLIEKALEEVGVTPTVISTTDQVSGALPLALSRVTLVKLHGDYLDIRIKNTESELKSYDPAINSLLDRIFDEYGLIVCGWSADWDHALRQAIERCPSRRFTTFWTTRSPLTDNAKRLAEHRKAEVIQIRDANQLFNDLSEKVRALEDMSAPHPLSAKLAVAIVKRYLVNPADQIRLRDLVHCETEKLFAALNKGFSPNATLPPEQELIKRVTNYETLCEPLLSILITGCYWGNQQHMKLWMDCLKRIANMADPQSGIVYLLNLRRYPALFLLYGCGLSAIASENYHTFAALLTNLKVKNDERQDVALCTVVYPFEVIEDNIGRNLPGQDRKLMPVNQYLFEKLRNPLHDYISGDDEYKDVFDRFEYLFGLVFADINRLGGTQDWWGPVGLFHLPRRISPKTHIIHKINREIEEQGTNWLPLKAGLFNSNLEQAKTAKAKFDEFLSQVH